jgi:hypothetical protein
MARMSYWAVKPTSLGPEYTRIEKAITSYEACRLAFGGPIVNPEAYHAKNLGTRLSVVQSDKQRINAIRDTNGWEKLSRDERKII